MVHPLPPKSKYARLLEWGKLITVTGGAQAIIQGIGLLSGILTIRLLSTHEYALYTLANTMLGTMTLLADGGISTGVMAQGGKVWQDRDKLGQVLVTGLELRKLFALGSFLVSVPLLLYLLIHHGAGWLTAVCIVAALAPSFFAALSNAQLQIAPKLHQDVATLQQNQLVTNLLRFGGLCLSILVFPYSAVAVLASGLPQLWSNTHLRKISHRYVDWHQSVSNAVRKNILNLVKRMLPGIVYYCLSGQITIWLISFFGSTVAVAQIGALSRLSMVLNVFSVVFNVLIVPRFARSAQNRQVIIKQFLQIQAGLIGVSISILALFQLFQTQILLILGENYLHLTSELLLSALGACLHLLFGSTYLLYTSKGWVINQFFSISLEVTAVIVGCLLFDITTIRGLLLMNIMVATIQLIMHVSFFFYKTSYLDNNSVTDRPDIASV